MNKNIEVEGGEIAIRNSHGDLAIIPKDKRDWVKQKLSEGCHGCIDSLVETLPVASQYAQDGTVYPNGTKVKVNQDNQIKEYDISSPEYKDLYNSGKLMSYDKTSDTYTATPLKEVTISAQKPDWIKYREDYEKDNPKSTYVNQYLTPFARSLGNTETNYPKRLDEEYETKVNEYTAQQIFKNNPIKQNESRGEYLDRLATRKYNSNAQDNSYKKGDNYRVQAINNILHNNLSESDDTVSNLWRIGFTGIKSLVEQNPAQTFTRILTDKNLSMIEKQNLLKDYQDHPILTKLGETIGTLSPLSIPYNATVGNLYTQQQGEKDYSIGKALQGQEPKNQNTALSIVADPLNLVGVGLAGKLSKVNKVIDATKAGSKVLNKLDDVVKNASLIPNWTVLKIKSVEEIDKLDNLHPVFKTFDKDTWKEIAQKKGNEYFLDRFNKQLVNVTNDLNSYENLAINISDYPEIIEGKKWSEDFVKSSEWKQRVKNANPDLTEEQINNLQKSTLLSMPSNMKTFIKNQASKNSFHGGQFTYDDLVHSRNVAFRYFTPEEVLDHPLHFKSLASHEFGHSQSTMRKLPNDKTWHQPLEESGDMMKTNDIYKGDRYVELSEEKRARSIPSYMFAKENNLLENGEFTEKTYDILKNMAEKDWKSVPNDFNSILSWYDKKSAINYLNKFYTTIPFYLYLQSQNQNQNKSEQ